VNERELPDLFQHAPLSAALVSFGSEPDDVVLRIQSREDFLKPDLIVYWVDGPVPVGDRIPDDALLLGAIESGRLPLPNQATDESGVLVLYSLAENEIVERSRLVKLAFDGPR
jgi:hypothetical protein